MSQVSKKPELVNTMGLPEYEFSSEDRLDSHYFILWNTKRWRKSNFNMKADPEVGWFGLKLFFEAQDETPVGTLPDDEELLAKTLGISVEHWRKLMGREINPLYNWFLVRCDNGEVRWAHEVVTEVTREAFKSRRLNQAKADTRALNKRLKDLRDMIENRIGAKHVLKNPVFVERFNEWLEVKYEGQQRRETFIRAALAEFQGEVMG
ncbi:MAG: hypothetical protein COB08_000790 [Rhodobacteraceae bacterium]|nr:hypothetical protein [Paracoccaceae bacterium]